MTNQLAPLTPDDFILFLDAAVLRVEHARMAERYGSDHTGRPSARTNCPSCNNDAFLGLAEFSRTAARKNMTRGEALAFLQNHPVALSSHIKSARRHVAVEQGQLARPIRAAHGATYAKAIKAAHRNNRLSTTPEIAQQVLAWVIRSVQDDTAPVESGSFVAWNKLEADLNWTALVESGDVASYVRAHTVFDEIVAACRLVPRADAMLNDHVFSHSAHLSRHTSSDSINLSENTAGTQALDNVTEEASLDYDAEPNNIVDVLALRVVRRLRQRTETTRQDASTLSRHEVMQVLGEPKIGSRDLVALAELVADNAMAWCSFENVIEGAANQIRKSGDLSEDSVRTAIVHSMSCHDYQLPFEVVDADSQRAHERWFAKTTETVLAAIAINATNVKEQP